MRLLGLISRWIMPRCVRVLEPQRRLVSKIGGIGHGERPPGLDQAGQVATFDVFHRQDDAVAGPYGRVGGDDVGVMELRRVADLAEEPLPDDASVQQVAADDLQDLLAAHEPVPGEVDDAHPAAPSSPRTS